MANVSISHSGVGPACIENALRLTGFRFADSHKGQEYNMPRLQTLLDSKGTYVDWELLTNDAGERTTAFGRFAGFCGAADGRKSRLHS